MVGIIAIAVGAALLVFDDAIETAIGAIGDR